MSALPSDPVFVAPPHPATIDPEALAAQCERGKGRTSGPGGQHRNKVETLVWLQHLPTGVESHAGERRSAAQNAAVALFRLRLRLAVQVRTPVPEGEIRSALWKQRCGPGGRIACNPEHPDYPSILAQAMDVVWAAGGDVKRASLRLCCSPSQLVKLLKDHPPALEAVNALRAADGHHALR